MLLNLWRAEPLNPFYLAPRLSAPLPVLHHFGKEEPIGVVVELSVGPAYTTWHPEPPRHCIGIFAHG